MSPQEMVANPDAGIVYAVCKLISDGQPFSPVGAVEQVAEWFAARGTSVSAEAIMRARTAAIETARRQEELIADAYEQAVTERNAEPSDAKPSQAPSSGPNGSVSAPPSVPFDLESEPGLLGDLARWSLSYSIRPIREFAQLSAIATLAPTFARRYSTPTGLGLNLYLVGLGATGSGKEALMGAPAAALAAAGLNFLIGACDFTSDSAIENALRSRPTFVALIDEIGEFIGGAQHRSAAPWSRTIRKALLTLHSKSRPDGNWSGKQMSGDTADKAADPIYSPSLSILGASTAEGFFASLTEDNLGDGMINRFIIVKGGKPGARNLDRARMAVPEAISAKLAAVYESDERGNLANCNSRIYSHVPDMPSVPWADDAACQAWIKIADWQDAAEEAGREGITGRAAANTQVIATIRALSRGPAIAAVTEADIAWAWEFVSRSIETVEYGAKHNMSGSEFQTLVNSLEHHIRSAGREGISPSVLFRKKGVGKHTPDMARKAIERLVELEAIYQPDIGSVGGGAPKKRFIAKGL